jgi:hypothetical protein
MVVCQFYNEETDAKMINHLNVWYYFKYIFLTVFGKGFGDRVRK